MNYWDYLTEKESGGLTLWQIIMEGPPMVITNENIPEGTLILMDQSGVMEAYDDLLGSSTP